MINDGVKRSLSFLYPTRLAALTGVSTPKTSSSSLKVPFLSPDFNEKEGVSSLNVQDQLALIDFLIAKAGYFDESKEAQEFIQEFRLPFEEIIGEHKGIFEELFLVIKQQVETLTAAYIAKMKAETLARLKAERKAQQADSDSITLEQIPEPQIDKAAAAEIIGQARINALKILSNRFKSLGAYYDKSSKYYFEENELTTSLSGHFTTALYANPQLAEKMLASHAEKTVGQTQWQKEELSRLVPSSYYQDVKDLRLIKDYFDLFLIEPRILAIAKSEPFETPKSPMGVRWKQTPELTQLEGALNSFLESHKTLFGTDLSDKKHFNVIEKLFYTLTVLMPARRQTINDQLRPLQEQKARLVAAEKARKVVIDATYLNEHHKIETLGELRDKSQIQATKAKMEAARIQDNEYKQIQQDIKTTEQAIANIENDFNHLTTALKTIRATAVRQYPGVEIAAKELAQHFAVLESKHEETSKFEKKGVFSCLSFLPVSIYNPKTQQYTYECLVALSGSEMDTGINPHKVLSEFANTLNLKIDNKNFRFRYVSPSAQNLDLILEQLGKGLSGQAKPLNVEAHRKILPEFTKQCAEKRLVTELMKLIARHGQHVQVLGCDNLALPRAYDALHALFESVKEKAPSASTKVAEKASAKPKAPVQPKVSEAKASAQPVQQPKEHVPCKPHKITTQLEGFTINLEAEHITCCTSCQAQKPAVFTFLYHTLQRTERLNREQAELMRDALTVPEKGITVPEKGSVPADCKTEGRPAEGLDPRKSINV